MKKISLMLIFIMIIGFTVYGGGTDEIRDSSD